MRILIADCSVIYTGRGDTKMNRAVRSILVKADGAVSVHNDAGNKPLNYMGAKATVFSESIIDDELVWRFENTKENLTIFLHHVISDSHHALDLHDEGLIRDGTEGHLRKWLSENPEVLGAGFTFVDREVNTGDGHVDIVARDQDGVLVAVEVKRIAMRGAVEQVMRYVNAMNESGDHGLVRGMIVALDIRPKTLIHAERKGVDCVTVGDAWKSRNQVDEEAVVLVVEDDVTEELEAVSV